MGEDNTGKLDLGIFIASIVPDGPADKDGRIKPGSEQHVHSADFFFKVSELFILRKTLLCVDATRN